MYFYPPSLTIPEMCINVEDIATLLIRRDAPFIAHLRQAKYFNNTAGSRVLTKLEPEVRNMVYNVLLKTIPLNDKREDMGEEEGDNVEEEDKEADALS